MAEIVKKEKRSETFKTLETFSLHSSAVSVIRKNFHFGGEFVACSFFGFFAISFSLSWCSSLFTVYYSIFREWNYFGFEFQQRREVFPFNFVDEFTIVLLTGRWNYARRGKNNYGRRLRKVLTPFPVKKVFVSLSYFRFRWFMFRAAARFLNEQRTKVFGARKFLQDY